MFVELLEKIRCPREHEPSPLIATASKTVDRHIITGTLGCPVCHAEFEVRDGALELGGSDIQPMPAPGALSGERMMRTAALLGLDERGGLYVLDYISSYFAAEFRDLSPNSMFVALSGNAELDASAVIVGHDDCIPLAAGCARGVALDRWSPALIRAAVEVLAPGGRLVAPAEAREPAGITVIARDETDWVGERELQPVVSEIRRAHR